jgi:aminoglycoside phosphotransferase (APT) family kinase protein
LVPGSSPGGPTIISFKSLLDALDEMHQKISGFQLPAQSYRTFASWIERGLTKVSEKYGEDTPFIPRFKKFMKERYPTLNLKTGNIHWDIHKSNVCLDQHGKLVILDMDLMQRGEFACDLSRAAFMYSSQDKFRFGMDSEIVELATVHLRESSPAVTVQDMKFFICRTPLGPMQLPDYPLSKDEAMAYLQSLDDFVGP